MVFERFDDYYHRPEMGFSNDKRLQFKTIKFLLAKEEATRMAAIRSGEVDIGRVSLGGREQIEAGGGRLIMSPEARAWQVGVAGCFRDTMPCSDIRVRQALSYAIDPECVAGPALRSGDDGAQGLVGGYSQQALGIARK